MSGPAEFPPLELKSGIPSRRGGKIGLRFSLLSLLVVAAAVCVGAAFYGMREREVAALRRLATLRQQSQQQADEIVRLRSELGYLTIGDKRRIHVLELPAPDDYHWKWRMYLPPERRWKLLGGVGMVPAEGYEKIAHTLSTVDGGEFTLEAFVDKDRDGRQRLVYRTPASTTRMGIAEAEFQQLRTNGYGLRLIGSGEMAVRQPGQPIELLRLRAYEELVDSGGGRARRSSDEPQFGFLLWIEEARPGE